MKMSHPVLFYLQTGLNNQSWTCTYYIAYILDQMVPLIQANIIAFIQVLRIMKHLNEGTNNELVPISSLSQAP